ncbi:hypothetical protein C8F04DRAFT_1272128 [Mycena alexandri]|uniref:Ribonuclease H1 N-terminal domain-containing protein n=1 Tax=Mycena alexandri TaxID=1745969 RepID=A0AAD6S8H5_9AGAR|nr:hypothetical protein C8F04DRAFT_1272128 [Mycena alexandri]
MHIPVFHIWDYDRTQINLSDISISIGFVLGPWIWIDNRSRVSFFYGQHILLNALPPPPSLHPLTKPIPRLSKPRLSPMSDPPPPYTDPVDESLLADLARLSVGHSTTTAVTGSTTRAQFSRSPPTFPCLPSSNPPSTPPGRSSNTPEADGRLYAYRSPTRTGVTSSWAEASAATQGVPGGHAHLVFKSPKARRQKKRASEAEAQVKGARPAIHQGYMSREAADAAFKYAVEHGWTRVSDRVPSHLLIAIAPAPLGTLPIPAAATNALRGENTGLWYAVFCGITPGVYGSALEFSLNTVGLSCASYASFTTEAAAAREFQMAARDGLVKIVTPLY